MTNRTEKLQRLGEALAQAREEALVRQTRRDQLERLQNEAFTRLAEAEKKRDLFDRVKVLLQESAEHARIQAKAQLEGLVTNALQYVFGPLFRFEIELSDHGGKPIAEFFVVTDWEGTPVKTKPQEARGGGIVDITSLALRVAMMETFRPRPEGPLILDEPGKHVSSEYVVPMLEFLKSAAEMFGRQVILVTHNNHLTEGADQAFEVTLAAGQTRVRPMGLLDNRTG
ncbi:ATP-binding protein [Desmospora profundinema]|uniref:DNA repair exonuclease SbcCD ATPase subunit n=1 Tax=Desmospora profundinema TaxID=1571184 RepID=A0ABU1IHL0_9BACL|nr:ATP-binding protein [Desmospora profundinema]MDR6224261.1 DNA repair exonuclease SbcCD ATPase subunit [Desmospora profundinema]